MMVRAKVIFFLLCIANFGSTAPMIKSSFRGGQPEQSDNCRHLTVGGDFCNTACFKGYYEERVAKCCSDLCFMTSPDICYTSFPKLAGDHATVEIDGVQIEELEQNVQSYFFDCERSTSRVCGSINGTAITHHSACHLCDLMLSNHHFTGLSEIEFVICGDDATVS